MPLESVLESFSILLGLRSESEPRHGLEVSKLAVRLGESIGLDFETLEGLRVAGLLHDIGKLGVLGAVLAKAGPLTRGEWAMVRKHPQFSYDIVCPLGLGREAEQAILDHQENYDGSGYPRALRGAGISRGGRILRIVDTYHSLRENRPYRAARTHAESLAVMREFANCYDPLYLDIFCRMEGLE